MGTNIPKYAIARNACCSTEAEKKLFDAVKRQIGIPWKELWKDICDYRDASSGVSGFIYYYDTERFAKRNLSYIIEVLADFELELGEPLKKDTGNLLNWYSWFALEWAVSAIMDYKESL